MMPYPSRRQVQSLPADMSGRRALHPAQIDR